MELVIWRAPGREFQRGGGASKNQRSSGRNSLTLLSRRSDWSWMIKVVKGQVTSAREVRVWILFQMCWQLLGSMEQNVWHDLIFTVDWMSVKGVLHLKFKILDERGIWRVIKATAFSSKLSVPGNRKLKILYSLNYSLVVTKRFPVAKVCWTDLVRFSFSLKVLEEMNQGWTLWVNALTQWFYFCRVDGACPQPSEEGKASEGKLDTEPKSLACIGLRRLYP